MKKKIITIGKTKPNTKSVPIILEIRLEERSKSRYFKTVSLTPITSPALTLSITGNIGDISGGQIDSTLQGLVVGDAIDYENGWNAERLTELLNVWERWHLNDLRPGCIHQSRVEAQKELTVLRNGVTEKKIAGWIYPSEHPEGMLMRPCPQCGYAYGSEWLFEYLPSEVIDFIKNLE